MEQSPPLNNPSFDRLFEYERLSLAHQHDQPEQVDQEINWSGVAFRLGESRLLCRITDVIEVMTVPAYTIVPGAKPWILGLASVRGNLVPICDLSWFLTSEPTSIGLLTRVIVSQVNQRPVGLLVDQVYGQRHFHTNQALDAASFRDSEMAIYVEHEFSYSDERWGVFSLNTLHANADFMNGAA